jgi:hypothetical protein
MAAVRMHGHAARRMAGAQNAGDRSRTRRCTRHFFPKSRATLTGHGGFLFRVILALDEAKRQ